MRIGVVGINHKLADLKLRDSLAKACQRRFSADASVHGEHTFVLLSTCNRTELYFCSDDLPKTHSYLLSILRQDVEEEFDQKLYSYFGYHCFMHLCRVTTGLDSAIVAETEIQGQVKNAYEYACAFRVLPYDLHYMFQKALKVGKQVRMYLPNKPGLPNVENAIWNMGLQQFGEPKDAHILLVGASEINRKVITFLKGRQLTKITLCNRSPEIARELAKRFQIQLLDWSSLSRWPQYDWIIFGTKSPEYLIKGGDVAYQAMDQKLIMDLCVPRNVDPAIENHPNITLMNIDQINALLKIRHDQMNESLSHAEQAIVDSTTHHLRLFRRRDSRPLSIVAV